MTTIAKGGVVAVFAAAKISGARLFGGERQRGNAAAFVGTVTEWLAFTQAAATPKVLFASFELHSVGAFLGNDRLTHA